MRKPSDGLLGLVVVLLGVALIWYALGFWVAAILSLSLLLLRRALLRGSFLFFLPKRIRREMDELRSREQQNL
jgi:hypothetical protein